MNTHTRLLLWFVLGVISLTQGTVIMYFPCSSQREEIRGQQTTAKPDTTHPTWGGSGGVEGVKVTVGEDLYLNLLCFTTLKPLF